MRRAGQALGISLSSQITVDGRRNRRFAAHVYLRRGVLTSTSFTHSPTHPLTQNTLTSRTVIAAGNIPIFTHTHSLPRCFSHTGPLSAGQREKMNGTYPRRFSSLPTIAQSQSCRATPSDSASLPAGAAHLPRPRTARVGPGCSGARTTPHPLESGKSHDRIGRSVVFGAQL